jgi:pimeloyl-ACP methyl ester carboxylesterase
MPESSAASNLAAQPTDRYLVVEGARLRFQDEGTGPAVVLLHGWTLDLEMWDPQVASLRREFRLVRMDRRGHGFSSGTASTQCDVADVAALCGHLGLNRVALIGMSQGARVAVAFARSAPERVHAVILDGPPAFDPAPIDEDVPLEHFRSVVRLRGMEAFRREWLRHPLTQLRTTDPQVRAHLGAMIARFAGNELAGSAPEREVVPLPASPTSWNAPTMVLSGELDVPRRVRSAARLSAQLRHAERAVITGAGHLPNLDRPDEYSEICRAFLSRHTKARNAP